MFSTLDKPASMKEMMSILSGARALSKKLNGCTNMCVVGATAGLNTNPHALADRTQAQSNAFFATHCMGGHKHSYCSQATQ